MMLKNSCITLLMFLSQALLAQTADDVKLAQQYMMNAEYEKAKDIYDKLYEDNPSITNYRYLLNCMNMLEDYKGAEKLISRQTKKMPDNLTFYVDLGLCYKKQGYTNKEKETYQAAIEKISINRNQVVQLANAFLAADQLQYAIQSYEQGRKKMPGETFNLELANLYYRSSNSKLAMQTYLDYLLEPSANIQSVYNGLEKMLDAESDHMLLQELVYERMQKKEEVVYSELLIWDLIQLKDYDGAFIQAKALDKRLRENGKRLFDLGEITKNEKQYDAAITCFQYIVDTHPKDAPYYYNAKSAILACRRLKIEETNNYTQNDIDELKEYYQYFIDEYPRNDNKAAEVMRDYARLEALYDHNVHAAITKLQDIITWPSLTSQTRNEVKLDLGDYYLISGDVWEATLLYSQVDKAMKDEPLGETARFKNAKLAYYRGDFALAQGQLEVLKAATSELVANDALELSVFITDNLGLDSVLEPMHLFAQTDLFIFQNKLDEAEATLQLLEKKYPAHKLADDIEFLRYAMAMKRNLTDDAILHLENIRQNYAYELLADDAIFKLGEIYQYIKGDVEKAKLCYEQIILNYSNSLYVNEARKRYRLLRGDKLNAN